MTTLMLVSVGVPDSSLLVWKIFSNASQRDVLTDAIQKSTENLIQVMLALVIQNSEYISVSSRWLLDKCREHFLEELSKIRDDEKLAWSDRRMSSIFALWNMNDAR
jgi:hypothetical protein